MPPPLLLVRLAAMAVAAPFWSAPASPGSSDGSSRPGPLLRSTPSTVFAIEDQMAAWVDGIIRRGHPFVRPGCLTRGVTLYYALRRAGDDVSLCFGVGTDEGEVAGHCWLDKAGEPLLERVDPLSKFTEVVRLTPEGVTH